MKKIEFIFIIIILILVVINISTSTSNKFLEERKFSFKEAIKVANAQPEGYPSNRFIYSLPFNENYLLLVFDWLS